MSMNIGAYTACLHNYDFAEALGILKTNGLTGAEVNVGGFIPSPHCPVDTLMASQTAREDYLGIFEDKEMRLAGLNTSDNPLSPLPDVGLRHAYWPESWVSRISSVCQARQDQIAMLSIHRG